MLNVVELYQTGDLGDWVVGLEPPELVVKKLIRDIQGGKQFNSNFCKLYSHWKNQSASLSGVYCTLEIWLREMV